MQVNQTISIAGVKGQDTFDTPESTIARFTGILQPALDQLNQSGEDVSLLEERSKRANYCLLLLDQNKNPYSRPFPEPFGTAEEEASKVADVVVRVYFWQKRTNGYEQFESACKRGTIRETTIATNCHNIIANFIFYQPDPALDPELNQPYGFHASVSSRCPPTLRKLAEILAQRAKSSAPAPSVPLTVAEHPERQKLQSSLATLKQEEERCQKQLAEIQAKKSNIEAALARLEIR